MVEVTCSDECFNIGDLEDMDGNKHQSGMYTRYVYHGKHEGVWEFSVKNSFKDQDFEVIFNSIEGGEEEEVLAIR